MRTQSAQKDQRLDQIGLPLAVAANKQVRTRAKFGVGERIVAKVGEVEPRDNHVPAAEMDFR